MTQIHLVRHGKAAAGFGSHKDPGLDELDLRQAQAVATMLHERHGDDRPLLFSSPLARAVETSQPLAQQWQRRSKGSASVRKLSSELSSLCQRSTVPGVPPWTATSRSTPPRESWRQQSSNPPSLPPPRLRKNELFAYAG